MRKLTRHLLALAVLDLAACYAGAQEVPASGAEASQAAEPTGQAAGQSAAPAGTTNEAVARQWSQVSTGAAPGLQPQEDGGTRIEWHGGVTVENYTNDIDTTNTFGSALRQGNHSLLRLQSDLRGITPTQDVNYLQLGAVATDDRAVLSQYPRHVETVQAGRAGAGYIVSAGDVAPNFSSLSSALGVRGFLGQRQFDRTTVSMYAGVVAPSWEYLDQLVPRLQLMKDVQGVKVEYAISDRLRAYVTGQHGLDLANSADISTLLATELHSASVGFQLADQTYSVAAETASSRFEQNGQDTRDGTATIVDGTWRDDTLLLRGGYHDVDAKFASLSLAARPGTRETYAGGDWMAASWMSLGADVRNGKTFTLPTVFLPAQLVDGDSGSVRANINFGADHPNWNLALQSSASNSRDNYGHDSSNEQNSVNLGYAREQWTATAGYSLGRMENGAFPTMNGDTDTWMASVGRSFSDQTAMAPPSWMVTTLLNTSVQDQHLLSGVETKAYSTSLNLAGQRADWGQLNLSLGTGSNSRPNGQSTLRMTSVQIDASRPLGRQGSIKLYASGIKRNISDATLYAGERVTGVQLTYRF